MPDAPANPPPVIVPDPPPAPATSPTGKAQFVPPAWFTWAAGGIAATAFITLQVAPTIDGLVLPPWLKLVLGVIAGLGLMFGAVSVGARNKAAMMLLFCLLTGTLAQAQELTTGPSLPAVAITPGATHPVALAPGAGIAVGLGLFPSTLAGKPVHILDVSLSTFGVVVPVDGAVAGNLSVALSLGVFDLLTVGAGMKLASTDGFGAFTGKLDHRSFFILIGVADLLLKLMNVGHEAPPQAQLDQPIDGDHPLGP